LDSVPVVTVVSNGRGLFKSCPDTTEIRETNRRATSDNALEKYF